MYNLLIIANKAGVAIAMHNIVFNTFDAAEEAVEGLREGLRAEGGYGVRYFISYKGDVDES